jgi:hypothetical protein
MVVRRVEERDPVGAVPIGDIAARLESDVVVVDHVRVVGDVDAVDPEAVDREAAHEVVRAHDEQAVRPGKTRSIELDLRTSPDARLRRPVDRDIAADRRQPAVPDGDRVRLAPVVDVARDVETDLVGRVAVGRRELQSGA